MMHRRTTLQGVLSYGVASWGGAANGLTAALVAGAAGVAGSMGSRIAHAKGLPTSLMQPIRVSAASDLKFALADVLNQFQRDTGLPVVASYGSSGQFARQIAQGLPTDLFMSADEALVTQLADQNLTQGAGVVYAVGRLALIVPRSSKLVTAGDWPAVQSAFSHALGGSMLAAPHASSSAATGKDSAASSIGKFAMANPEHAPYGRAAQQALEAMGLWRSVEKRLVLGENIAQATQFVATGAAQAGLTALSLAVAPEVAASTRYAAVPAHLHAPLRQRMVLLKTARPQARALLDYLQTPAVRQMLQSKGFAAS